MKNIFLLLGSFVMMCTMTQAQEDENVITDERDNQTYKTGVFGDQIWLIQNLNFAHENSWCYNDEASNCKSYGRIYSYEAAQEACPAGYHLPSQEDWNKLIEFYGGADVAGGKMSKWGQDNFNIKFAGKKLPYGKYNYMRNYAFYWSSTANDAGNIFVLTIKAGNQNCGWNPVNQNGGYYVRCVKDGE